jgi:hypothetical protein
MMMKPTLWVAALVLHLAFVLASCGGGGQGGGQGGGGGESQTTSGKKATTETTTAHKKATIGVTKSYSNLSRDHVRGHINYPQNPPVGGPHNPVWQNCGFYSKPVRNEHAVHSMEHGAVWITYRPDLPKDQVEKLKSLTQKSYVLASPYPGLPAPVVASAWGKQLRLNSANDPRLEQFVIDYSQGLQTPEPGAPCSGGVGSPE